MKVFRAQFFLIFLVSSIFISCATTRTYEKTSQQFFQDDLLIGEETSLVMSKGNKIDPNKKKVKEQKSRYNPSYNLNDAAETENFKNLVNYEKAVVESKPNGKYIAYSFLGKPFVILGATIFNLIKSLGYSFINFMGGYSTMQNGDFFWMMPDVNGARKKADKAKIENQIAYPEYHIPFTDNHIAIDRITGETETRVSEIDPDEITVTSKEEHEFDNSLSVKKSVEKDVNRTTSVIGLAGTIITVPISAVTWVFGAVAGLYYK